MGVDQVRGEFVGAGAVQGLLQFSLGTGGFAVEQVLADRPVQQRGVLRDHADLCAQAFLRDRGDVLAVDQDAAALDVVESQQQVDQRRLAGAGGADQPDLLARAHRQVHAFDDA
ncbi:hypothetical protein D3C72_1321090 [compost metagenome]